MCDAACVKIIINGGFMITLAPLVERGGGDVGAAARRLKEAATIQRDLILARGLSVSGASGADGFDGCDQAKTLVQWITAGKCPTGAVHQIDTWTAEIWRQIEDLVAGKFPS